MSFDLETLYKLLPAIYQIRDLAPNFPAKLEATISIRLCAPSCRSLPSRSVSSKMI